MLQMERLNLRIIRRLKTLIALLFSQVKPKLVMQALVRHILIQVKMIKVTKSGSALIQTMKSKVSLQASPQAATGYLTLTKASIMQKHAYVCQLSYITLKKKNRFNACKETAYLTTYRKACQQQNVMLHIKKGSDFMLKALSIRSMGMEQ